MDSYKSEYTTLGIGDAGCYATAPNQHSHVYTHITIYDRRLSAYFGDLAEGGVVIDKRPCIERDMEDFVKVALGGPMLAEHLPAGHKQSMFEQPIPWSADARMSGFDYVSLDLYLEVWRRAGAKIGKRVGETIQWESGEVSPIPPAEERWLVKD